MDSVDRSNDEDEDDDDDEPCKHTTGRRLDGSCYQCDVVPDCFVCGTPLPHGERSPCHTAQGYVKVGALVSALRKAAHASDMSAPSDWLVAMAAELEGGGKL